MIFTFTQCPSSGYQVYSTDGAHLGDVERRGRSGWSSRLPEDAERTPADSDTRREAAERLIVMRANRDYRAELNTPAPPPEGYEVIDASVLKRGDLILTPQRVTEAGEAGSWSFTPLTVCRAKAFRTVVSINFEFDPATPGEHRWSHIASGRCRLVARRIETEETRAAAAAAATVRHHSSLTDFDFMTLIDWHYRVANEHSATYAFANWEWRFDAPELNERTRTLQGMLAFEAEYAADVDRFERRHSVAACHGWISWRSDETRHREEHAALFAARRDFDDEFIILKDAEHAEQWRTATGAYAARAVYSRTEPGGEWIECTGPILPAAQPASAARLTQIIADDAVEGVAGREIAARL